MRTEPSVLKVMTVSDFKTSNKVTFLPRFGLRLFLAKEFDTADYYGYGPGQSYIDMHQSAWMGLFHAKISQMHEDMIKPQDNGAHYACKFAEVHSKDIAIRFESERSFSFQASEYTQEELAQKKHNYELEKCGSSVICLDNGMAGVGSASCGPELDDSYKIALPKLHLDFTMIIT